MCTPRNIFKVQQLLAVSSFIGTSCVAVCCLPCLECCCRCRGNVVAPQISNNCGMLHYTSGGQFKVPVVIRGPGGVGRQLGAEHSQRLESYFQSIPGVQLVAVSTVANAKALLKSVRAAKVCFALLHQSACRVYEAGGMLWVHELLHFAEATTT
jgi:pyruvate/2-oxoglutarate/acetoin dehydrogenase E1 component